MDLGLAKRTALVCAASRGLGYASAQALAAEGCNLLICSRDAERSAAAAGGIADQYGVSCHPVACDLTTEGSSEQLRQAIEQQFGQLDIIVHNVGGPAPGTVLEAKVADYEAACQRLLLAPIRLTQALLPLLRHSDQGRIITIASVATRECLDNLATSTAIRSAVVAWSKTLARQLAAEGITANCISPGIIATERIAEIVAAQATARGISPDLVEQEMLAQQPSGRFGRPPELGAMVAMLASKQAAYLSGQNIVVDGALNRAMA